jgi:hypothetical protein
LDQDFDPVFGGFKPIKASCLVTHVGLLYSLVGGSEHGVIIPTDEHIFQRVETTN